MNAYIDNKEVLSGEMATRKITYHCRRDKVILKHVIEKGALFPHDVVSNLCTLVRNSVAFGACAMKLDEPIKRLCYIPSKCTKKPGNYGEL